MKRTFEISLPSFHIKDLLKPGFLLIIAGLAVIVGSIYWKLMIHPYFVVDKAILRAATVQIYAPESGKIESYTCEEGAPFRKGQFLLSLHNGLLFSQLKSSESQIALCQQKIESEKERLDGAMQQYLQLQNEIGLAEPLDSILSDIQEAQQSQSDLEHELASLQLEKAAVQRKIDQLGLPAPFEGVVLRRYKEMGEMAVAGESILLVCDSKQRWIETEIPERFLSLVKNGTSAVVEFSSYPNQKWNSSVSWISPIVEDGKFRVRLVAENLPLQPGLSAKAKIRIR